MQTTLGRVGTEELKIGDVERRSGLYILGKPGMGKSTLLANLMFQDTERAITTICIDPHGDTLKSILTTGFNIGYGLVGLPTLLPGCYVLYLDPTDEEYTFALNPLACVDHDSLSARMRAYNKTYTVFQKLWEEEWGVWLQLILENTIPVFIENQEYTLAEVPLFLTDTDFRAHLLKSVRHCPGVLDFWAEEFQPKPAESALTRIRSPLSNTYVRHIIGQKVAPPQPKRPLASPQTLLECLVHGSFVGLHLPAGLAEDARKFIGTIFMTERIYAIQERPDDAYRKSIALYVDEFQHFATAQFATLILEGRKHECAVTIAHQERSGQVAENQKIMAATSACANKILCQTTIKDAQEFAPEFALSPQEERRKETKYVITRTPVDHLLTVGHEDT